MAETSIECKKGGDWSNWPADLRVREYPTIAEEATA
jgi:hypothetical protein